MALRVKRVLPALQPLVFALKGTEAQTERGVPTPQQLVRWLEVMERLAPRPVPRSSA